MPSSASTKPQRSSRLPEPLRAILLSAFVALLVCLPTPLHPQEEEDLTLGLVDLRMQLDRGRALFNELKFPEAILELTKAIETYEGGNLQDFGEKEVQIVAEALDLRARAYFNQGDTARARGDFVHLLRVKIDYKLDKNFVSPKVVALFEQVQKETLGSLSVTTDPPGAEVWLNDDPLPRTPVVGRLAIAGNYKLKLSLKGFQDHQEEVKIAPRTGLKREIRLTPNLRNLQFVTQPSGVNVRLDGELQGTTFGTLSPDLHTLAREAGLDPLKTSAPLLVKHVAPGAHEVRFEKECYEPSPRAITVALDLEKNSPQVFQPVLLKEDLGQLKITSHPSGAEVFLDGQPQGTTPVQLPATCAGERDVRLVKKGGGTWFEPVRIKPGAINALDVSLRPTLLYVGAFRLDEWSRLTVSDEDKLLRESLPSLRSVNRVPPGEHLDAFRSALLEEMTKPEYVEQLRKGAGLPPPRVLDAVTRFQADLVMAVVTLQDRPGRGAPTLFLYSSEQPEPDTVRLDLSRPEAVRSFLASFDEPPKLVRPWIGASFTDTLLDEGPVAVRVVKGGAAAGAGLMAGDLVESANGKRTVNAQALASVTSALKEKGRLSLVVRREGTARTIGLTVGRTPVLIPMNSPGRLYNKALCDYRELSRGADDPMDRALALLNLGISYMHFRSYDKALSEALNLATLPPGSGVSRGTVRYYQGLCYLRKDLIPEARTAFQDAIASVDATLESNDGAPVATRARKLLQ